MPITGCREVNIGSRMLGGRIPHIAISIFDTDSGSLMKSFGQGKRDRSALYEIRYDLFTRQEEDDLKTLLEFLNEEKVDFIFTYRSFDRDSLKLFYGAASRTGVPAADIEISVSDQVTERDGLGTLILSHHSYSGESVVPYYHRMLPHSPGIIKLASSYPGYDEFSRDQEELRRLKEKDGVCLSLIPMGSENRFLRALAGYTVSDLVYARESGETGEGQLTVDQYRKCFDIF